MKKMNPQIANFEKKSNTKLDNDILNQIEIFNQILYSHLSFFSKKNNIDIDESQVLLYLKQSRPEYATIDCMEILLQKNNRKLKSVLKKLVLQNLVTEDSYIEKKIYLITPLGNKLIKRIEPYKNHFLNSLNKINNNDKKVFLRSLYFVNADNDFA